MERCQITFDEITGLLISQNLFEQFFSFALHLDSAFNEKRHFLNVNWIKHKAICITENYGYSAKDDDCSRRNAKVERTTWLFLISSPIKNLSLTEDTFSQFLFVQNAIKLEIYPTKRVNGIKDNKKNWKNKKNEMPWHCYYRTLSIAMHWAAI